MKRHELIKEHIKRIEDRYRDSDKARKKVILDELCETWGIGRKYAIRLLNGRRMPTGKKPGRPCRYDIRLVRHLTVLWNAMERICPKRMKAALPVWLPFYRDPELDARLRDQLLSMSASTIARFLRRGRKTLKGLSGTKKAVFFKHRIPIPLHAFTEKIVNAGHVAADTVAHCGDSLSGDFVNTLTVTDRLTGWTENRALFTKKTREMRKALFSIESGCPFRFLSIQTDCGTEFLNYSMVSYLQNRPRPVTMSRSRPYHKNDSAHVEQKNNTHVRELFGYERLEDPALVGLMNEIYRDYWNPLHNFFLPSMKLCQKERNGARVTKRYDKPRTPYERLMLAPNLTEERKQALRGSFQKLNPFELKAGLERKLEQFFSLLRQGKKLAKVA